MTWGLWVERLCATSLVLSVLAAFNPESPSYNAAIAFFGLYACWVRNNRALWGCGRRVCRPRIFSFAVRRGPLASIRFAYVCRFVPRIARCPALWVPVAPCLCGARLCGARLPACPPREWRMGSECTVRIVDALRVPAPRLRVHAVCSIPQCMPCVLSRSVCRVCSPCTLLPIMYGLCSHGVCVLSPIMPIIIIDSGCVCGRMRNVAVRMHAHCGDLVVCVCVRGRGVIAAAVAHSCNGTHPSVRDAFYSLCPPTPMCFHRFVAIVIFSFFVDIAYMGLYGAPHAALGWSCALLTGAVDTRRRRDEELQRREHGQLWRNYADCEHRAEGAGALCWPPTRAGVMQPLGAGPAVIRCIQVVCRARCAGRMWRGGHHGAAWPQGARGQ